MDPEKFNVITAIGASVVQLASWINAFPFD